MTEKARLHDLALREDVTIDGDVPQAKLIKLGGLGQCTLKQAFIVGPMCGQELGVFAGTGALVCFGRSGNPLSRGL